MKYHRVTADYRPNNPNKPTYEFRVKDSATKKQMREWFATIYPWLKVYRVDEITEDECGKWVRG